MKVSILSKLQLAIVFIVMRVLWVIDEVGIYSRKTAVNTVRIGMYIILVGSFFTGFYVVSKGSGFTNVANVLNPQVGQVLGSALLGPYKTTNLAFPNVTAQSVYAVDLRTNNVLVDISSNVRLAPASTTKLMTAFVALDLYELDEVLVVPEFCTQIEGLKTGLYAHDSYSVFDLITTLLVNSSADAACTLAIGKKPYSQFVDEMNLKAKQLGLDNSSFSNPIGLDGENGNHITTAKDLYKLAKAAGTNKIISQIVKIKNTTITSASGNSAYISNTNDLLWLQPGTVGIKTGRTQMAGEVLIYEYDLDEKNFVIVVMKSTDRFEDTLMTLNWILNSYSWGSI